MPWSSVRGFSLIELLVVLVLIGTALSIALPKASALRQRMLLDGAAQQVLGDLQRAQFQAIRRNQSVRVVLTGPTSYSIESAGARELDGGVQFLSAPDTVRFASFGPPASGPAMYVLRLGSREKRVELSAAGFLRVR
jgi:prepilin-type N-terminal cleavage/methylation domain-containing protein